jgi:hypothetical protein
MADAPDGIDLMRSRMQRGRRTPPPPRRTVTEATQTVSDPEPVVKVGETTTVVAPPVPRPGQKPVRRAPAVPVRRWRPEVAHGSPTANLALRVRQPLDDHLADVVHAFRREGVRTSKVELVEMLLWELPQTHTELRTRLAEFRQTAARGGDAPLEGRS